MRIVLDTNTVVSGLLWENAPRKLIDAATDGKVELFSSRVLLAELSGVLHRVKFAQRLARQRLTPATLIERYTALAEVVTPAIIAPTITRDPDDDAVLATALAAQAELIVSGDAHLLDLKVYHGTPIVTAVAALERIKRA